MSGDFSTHLRGRGKCWKVSRLSDFPSDLRGGGLVGPLLGNLPGLGQWPGPEDSVMNNVHELSSPFCQCYLWEGIPCRLRETPVRELIKLRTWGVKYAWVQEYRSTGVQEYRSTSVQLYSCTVVQVYRCKPVQVYTCTGV